MKRAPAPCTHGLRAIIADPALFVEPDIRRRQPLHPAVFQPRQTLSQVRHPASGAMNTLQVDMPVGALVIVRREHLEEVGANRLIRVRNFDEAA